MIRIFLCSDVMTGRGIDQILPRPAPPRLYERGAASALEYVELAVSKNGAIPWPVNYRYIWGHALEELERLRPDPRIINLETSVTTSEDYIPKGINYRMSPGNVPCITAASIDCCVLANNHVLDWGYAGLSETLKTLADKKVKTVGAGIDAKRAEAPALIDVADKERVIVFAFGNVTSGIPRQWAAAPDKAGINLLPDISNATVGRIGQRVREVKRPGDIVVASVHWGGNWGYEIPRSQIEFAHGLIDEAGVDIVHGHSSHHVKGIEIYDDRPILYGCGDFLNDYEGISGYEEFRGDLSLMYFLDIDPRDGKLRRALMTPLNIRNFKLNRASHSDSLWLRDVLNREGKKFGTRVGLIENDTLALSWA